MSTYEVIMIILGILTLVFTIIGIIVKLIIELINSNFKYNIPATSFSMFLVFKFVDIILQIAYNIP